MHFLPETYKMQKVWCYEEYGGKEVLKLRDFPIPTPLQNQLLVQVRAAALNPIDYKRRQRPIFPSDFPVSTFELDFSGFKLNLSFSSINPSLITLFILLVI